MKTTLFIKSNDLKGFNLFELVLNKLNIFKSKNFDEFDNFLKLENIDLVIDGDDWMWELNSNLQLTGISKNW